eukprot:COSAG01_NODE_4625_length_4865_cov_7.434326_4_plen_58_part_00
MNRVRRSATPLASASPLCQRARALARGRLEEVEKEGWGSGLWIHPDARAAWNAAAGL